jgi:hypothetical protein
MEGSSKAPTLNKHRKTAGYAICIHECVVGGCLNSQGSTRWIREGNSLRKHCASKVKHPECPMSCPGHQAIGKHGTGIAYPYQVVIEEDERTVEPDPLVIPFDDDASKSSSDQSPFPTIDLNDRPQSLITGGSRQHLSSKVFKVIYVPDPTRCMTQSKATSDLAFLKTSVPVEEYRMISHLEGSVHCISSKKAECIVLMQEWVSKMVKPYQSVITTLLIVALYDDTAHACD